MTDLCVTWSLDIIKIGKVYIGKVVVRGWASPPNGRLICTATFFKKIKVCTKACGRVHRYWSSMKFISYNAIKKKKSNLTEIGSVIIWSWEMNMNSRKQVKTCSILMIFSHTLYFYIKDYFLHLHKVQSSGFLNTLLHPCSKDLLTNAILLSFLISMWLYQLSVTIDSNDPYQNVLSLSK